MNKVIIIILWNIIFLSLILFAFVMLPRAGHVANFLPLCQQLPSTLFGLLSDVASHSRHAMNINDLCITISIIWPTMIGRVCFSLFPCETGHLSLRCAATVSFFHLLLAFSLHSYSSSTISRPLDNPPILAVVNSQRVSSPSHLALYYFAN